jgi:hypothetical protein
MDDRLMTEGEHIVIAPAGGSDREQGYLWSWVVIYGGERRSGACRTHEDAQREAATVLKLLREQA